MKTKKQNYLYSLLNIFLIFFLINHTKAADHQKSFQPDIQIVFISNLNGVIENCNCGHPPLGGLNYISTIIDSLRQQNKELVFIDGGDFSNPYPFAEINEAVLEIYKILQPDIIALGEQEFIEGKEYFNKIISAFGKKILATNLTVTRATLNETLKLKSLNVLSYMDESTLREVNEDMGWRFNNTVFEKLYSGLKDSEINILVYHGTLKKLELFLKKYVKFNLVLLSHDYKEGLISFNSPVIVGGGADGEHLMDIKINKNNKSADIMVDMIPVSKNRKSDPRVEKIIALYHDQVKTK
ncbi:MAG: hypothetical protein JXR46_07205 [Calditrichaceae bacterium]|nr:hypothetical protein [Calditrichaceae bacterium]MBN2708817.1 hypothetical protein [Calditrichaceae bacterium]RQV97654.1 MAG: hypothetical protein EH224_01150 [Calditrichota bacterium]